LKNSNTTCLQKVNLRSASVKQKQNNRLGSMAGTKKQRKDAARSSNR